MLIWRSIQSVTEARVRLIESCLSAAEMKFQLSAAFLLIFLASGTFKRLHIVLVQIV